MPDAPPIHHTYISIEDAEAWAQSLGVSARYDARLDLSNLANELLWQLNKRGLPLPDMIRIDAEAFRGLNIVKSQTPASTNKGRISINPASLFWLDPVGSALQQYQLHYWSTSSFLHVLYHEAAHVLVYRNNPDGFDTLRDLTNAQKTVVISEVSHRACLDAHEFVSEVFAGLMAGRKFGKDIMRWYRSRGGVKV